MFIEGQRASRVNGDDGESHERRFRFRVDLSATENDASLAAAVGEIKSLLASRLDSVGRSRAVMIASATYPSIGARSRAAPLDPGTGKAEGAARVWRVLLET